MARILTVVFSDPEQKLCTKFRVFLFDGVQVDRY